jgi:hypothetical protein
MQPADRNLEGDRYIEELYCPAQNADKFLFSAGISMGGVVAREFCPKKLKIGRASFD